MMNFPDAPTTGQTYSNYKWDGEKWMPLPATFTDAPVTGKIYGRKDASWAEIISDVTKAYVDTEIAKTVKKVGDTMSGALGVTVNGSTFGQADGTGAGGAVARADANVMLYNNSASNWAGIGTDGSGVMWFRTGTSGSPVPAMYINIDRNVVMSNNLSAVHLNTTEGYAAQFGGTASTGFHVDGVNVAIRPPPGGSIYFQGGGGTPTFGYWNSGALNISGPLNVGGLATINAGMTWVQQPASVYQGGPGGLLINANGSAGYDAFISYHRPGGGYACNMGLMNDNRFGFGGWSVGAAQYRFWSREDFTEPPVHNTRLVYVGDYSHGLNTALAEPYGGTGCVTGGAGFNNGTYEHTQRYRQLQVRRSDGYYGSEEA